MVASYYRFTIFPALMALNVHAMSIVIVAPFATISLLLKKLSNPLLNLKTHLSLKTYQQ
jgi:hypothetical protein